MRRLLRIVPLLDITEFMSVRFRTIGLPDTYSYPSFQASSRRDKNCCIRFTPGRDGEEEERLPYDRYFRISFYFLCHPADQLVPRLGGHTGQERLLEAAEQSYPH